MNNQQKCLELWKELNDKLPEKGRSGNLIEGNWSCWVNGRHIIGGNGMDCWPMIEFVTDKVKPTNILEIGFNAGHSSCMWLSETTANITSVDIKYTDSVRIASDFVKNKFSDRFNFIHCDSRLVYEQIKDKEFDMIVVDGGHGEDVCFSDLNLAIKLKTKYLLIDDVIVAAAVRKAVDTFVSENKDKLTLIQQWKHIITCLIPFPLIFLPYGIIVVFSRFTSTSTLR